MKLSEAIRLGACLRPQYRGNLYGRSGRRPFLALFDKRPLGSCALGAAYEAAGIIGEKCEVDGGVVFRGESIQGRRVSQVWNPPSEWHPVFFATLRCPCCLKVAMMCRLITHLNDETKWSREQIADFVESTETKLERRPTSEDDALQALFEFGVRTLNNNR